MPDEVEKKDINTLEGLKDRRRECIIISDSDVLSPAEHKKGNAKQKSMSIHDAIDALKEKKAKVKTNLGKQRKVSEEKMIDDRYDNMYMSSRGQMCLAEDVDFYHFRSAAEVLDSDSDNAKGSSIKTPLAKEKQFAEEQLNDQRKRQGCV